ncbi:MAG: molybdenum cofactor guanylyltransferase [Opitutaceae bacterium]|nr:molybdenum cofactor guanylyltransferase [Opitutaceae bacterium]
MLLTPTSAVLLAAGRSVRMGRDKALIEIEGAPLWRRQRAVLAASGAGEILLSARPDQTWVVEAAREFAAVVSDPVPDAGPLAGIVAALAAAKSPHLAVLAIDLPRMDAVWFATLAARCAPGRGAVGRRGEFFEPLAAIYPREIAPLARAALSRGEGSLQRLLTAAVAAGLMQAVEISAAEAGRFTNWNEPAGEP